MSVQLVITVVIYNKLIRDIRSLETFTSAAEEHHADLLVIDNSTQEKIIQANKKESLKGKCRYICNNANLGLSKCYNQAISYAGQYDDYFVMLADDDTFISKEYIDHVVRETDTGHADIMCGIIKTQKGPFSPVKERTFFGGHLQFITEPGIYTDICAVNTGLVIRKRIFDLTGGFDERLFLDMVDYHFMNVLSRIKENRILVLPGSIEQEFSGEARTTIKAQRTRLKIFSKDVRTFCRLNNIPAVYGRLLIMKRYLSVFIRSL